MHVSRKLIGAGWKSASMVDVHQAVTFTLWLCGCNLRCPFCHNWKLALWDKNTCKPLDEEKILDALESSRLLVDYFHVTGGEPLVQWSKLMQLVVKVKDNIGVPFSLNTNLTLYKPLEIMLKKNLVDHVATDLKAPPETLYGLPVDASKKLWSMFLRALSLVSEHNIPLELRVPVARNIDIVSMEKYIDEALNTIKHNEYYIVVQPILGPPVTSPRNLEWCGKYCNPSKQQLEEVAALFRDKGVSRVFVKTHVRTLDQIAKSN